MLEQVIEHADRHIDIYYLAPPRWGFVLTLVYYESSISRLSVKYWAVPISPLSRTISG